MESMTDVTSSRCPSYHTLDKLVSSCWIPALRQFVLFRWPKYQHQSVLFVLVLCIVILKSDLSVCRTHQTR